MEQNTNTNPVGGAEQKVSIMPVEILIPGIKPDTETPRLSVEERESDKDTGHIRTGHAFDTTYLEKMLSHINDKFHQDFIIKFIKGTREKIKGQIIVDLGAGSTNLGYCTSLLFGASKYVAVEKYNKIAKNLSEQLGLISLKNGEIPLNKPSEFDGRKILREQKIVKVDNLIPAGVVQDKILHFLKRLPDNSVSILTSGINYALIDNTEYRDAIAQEIERVLSPAGAYVSRSSDINVRKLATLPNLSSDELEIKVFIKKI